MECFVLFSPARAMSFNIWKCSWCGVFFGDAGVALDPQPSEVDHPVSHGLCRPCLPGLKTRRGRTRRKIQALQKATR